MLLRMMLIALICIGMAQPTRQTDDGPRPDYETPWPSGRVGEALSLLRTLMHEPFANQIGAIDVADSDPRFVYVGTGSDGIRSNVIIGRGVYKSTDGGETWNKLTNGLPTGDTGKIGLAIYRANPEILMAIVEHGFQPGRNDEAYADMTQLGTGLFGIDIKA